MADVDAIAWLRGLEANARTVNYGHGLPLAEACVQAIAYIEQLQEDLVELAVTSHRTEDGLRRQLAALLSSDRAVPPEIADRICPFCGDPIRVLKPSGGCLTADINGYVCHPICADAFETFTAAASDRAVKEPDQSRPATDAEFCASATRVFEKHGPTFEKLAAEGLIATPQIDFENQRRQLEALGLLGEFAPSCDIADHLGEALLRARAEVSSPARPQQQTLREWAAANTCSEVHEGTLCSVCRYAGVGCVRAWALNDGAAETFEQMAARIKADVERDELDHD